jgi:hypothetical protein
MIEKGGVDPPLNGRAMLGQIEVNRPEVIDSPCSPLIWVLAKERGQSRRKSGIGSVQLIRSESLVGLRDPLRGAEEIGEGANTTSASPAS